ncbi:MAG TPA: hypothetical protein VF185_02140 [Patescibacteria group bacterium]
MERILESRKAFDLSRYQKSEGFNRKALERDTAALVIESSGNIHSFFLAHLSNGLVVNPSLDKTRDVKDFYSDETPQTQKEKIAGLIIRQALVDEEPGTVLAWVSPPGGEFNYQEGRFEIGKVREILGVKVLQSYGIPLKDVTPEYCEKLFLMLEEFSDKPSQQIKAPEDLRDKISIFLPPQNSNWVNFLSSTFPELSVLFEKISHGEAHHLKMKALKDAREESKKVLNDAKVSKEDLLHRGARIENGMEERGWNLSRGGCGVLNRDLLSMQNKSLFGMVKIVRQEDEYGSLNFECPYCHRINTREPHKLLSNCKHCGENVKC